MIAHIPMQTISLPTPFSGVQGAQPIGADGSRPRAGAAFIVPQTRLALPLP